MQLGMKIPHDYNALYVMISKLNVDEKLQRDFFNTIGGERMVGFMFEGNKKRPWKLKGDVLLSFGMLFAMMAR